MNTGSRKFTRSDKKRDGNDTAGNFVFNFNATPSFNFCGDNKAIPPTPPQGTSSAPPLPSASKPVFVFGTGGGTDAVASSTSTNPPLAFNIPATASPKAPLRRNYTDIAPTSSTTGNTKDLRRAQSDTISSPTSPFTSGTGTNTNAPPAFTFGAQSSTPTFTTASTSAPMSTAVPTVGTSAFTFGTPPNTTTPKPASTTPNFALPISTVSTTKSQQQPAPTFSFGTPATSAPIPATTTEKTLFSSGSSTTPATTPATSAAPVATTTTSAPAGTTGFSFGKPATTTPAATASFSFGSSSTSSASATPSGTKEAPGGFSFATPTTSQKATITTTSATAPSFSFNAPTSASPVSDTTSTTTPTLTFGTSTSTTPDASTKVTPTLGKKEDTTKKSDATATPSTPLFVFGSSTTTTPKSSSSLTTAAPTTSSTSGLPSFSFTPTTSTSAPVVSSGSGAPNSYSFSTILENMQTAANQPPVPLAAVLITPSLNALRQNRVVTHTNFRIDNILPTTRYTELPEQAKKELDELDRYIHGESQRCSYSTKQALPKRHESMTEATREQEVLTYKLGSLSSGLQMQVNALEELFDSLKDQIRHFNDGQAVIEACRHPGGRLSRWLYPSSADDDYFVSLSTHLTTRLKEYKDCIREIEFTVESWTKNKAQSPQDIARVIESQNQTFLALTDKAAALHERLQLEQDLYTQYRLQSITL
ncbi:hypothetical protein BCR42DRAFT_457380 [Absidia repens]|uniref:Nucleoporin NSP1-like C-terminal domain-containing protein n=1 Tax=Absidia repens TaxID=90262 RepID=A0A1X2HR20_9FUNG|nr:hypothetical protein BCR42DRAFT_457380 [Absidia repens]